MGSTLGQLKLRMQSMAERLQGLSTWLLLLAVLWLCWGLARLLWLVLAPPSAPTLSELPRQAPAIVSAENSRSFAIFESPSAPQAQKQPPPNVTLKGVMIAVPESQSSALLEIQGQVKNYRIGDELQDSGYRLMAVDWNEVIIVDSSNAQMVLRLRDAMDLDQADSIGRGSSLANISNNRLPPVDTSLSQPPETQVDNSSAQGNGNTAQSAISEAVSELQQNPASYLSRMGVMATGDGYQVTDAMPDNVRQRLGLEPGDRVLSVNGQAVGSNPGQDAGLLQQVQQSGEAQIQVQRGEQVITIRQQF